MSSKTPVFGWLLPALLAVAAVWPAASRAQSDSIDPDALLILKRSNEYVAGLKQFRVDTTSSIDVVLTNGQKIQLQHQSKLTVQRPNKLRAERVGEIVDQVFTYDGKSLSVSLPKSGYHATVPAPATIEATIDFARDQLDVIAPASDLIYKNANDLLTSKLTAAYIIGDAVVEGVRCHHLAFRNAEVDWQIFIQEGQTPLPRKFVVTSKKMPQSPDFSVVMTQWNTTVKVSDAMFAFSPAKGSRKIDFLPAAAAAKK